MSRLIGEEFIILNCSPPRSFFCFKLSISDAFPKFPHSVLETDWSVAVENIFVQTGFTCATCGSTFHVTSLEKLVHVQGKWFIMLDFLWVFVVVFLRIL